MEVFLVMLVLETGMGGGIYITVVQQDEGVVWVCGGEDGDAHGQ